MWDRDVRFAVRERLQREHCGDDDTRIVEEMGIWNGAVRVDVAVINGELAAYELKSARDTLTRLPNQAALYSLVFDRVSLVAAEKHLEAAQMKIPEWWGVIRARTCGDSVELEEVRKAQRNPSQDPIQLAKLLWKEETIGLLQANNALTGHRSASRDQLARRLTEVLDHSALAHGVRRCLKDRSTWLR
ncbi:sce7726 family protein [Parablastomonas sp. CN1-191]|uniref:sce7726 family protein n=1 Tax=Parablastomonas sp. CN1-191 TaxID=3400908 RepID=UPI003BF7EE66